MNMAARRTCLEVRAEPLIRTSGAKRQGGFCRPAGRPFVPLEGGAGGWEGRRIRRCSSELPERSDKAASADRPEGRLSPWKGVQGVRKVGESDAVHQNFRSEATRRLLPTGRKAVCPPGRGCRGLGRSENPTLFIRTASDGCRPAGQGCAPSRLRGRLWNVP